MVTGSWDPCLAQALAAEVSERHLVHRQWEQQHGKLWRDKEAEEYAQAREARKVMDNLAFQIYREVTSCAEGRKAVRLYLLQPMLCGCCLNVMDSLAPCLDRCGRKLCKLCRSPLGICTNRGICAQKRPSMWRVGVKVCDHNNPLFQLWRAAAREADLLTDICGWGHRLAAC